MTVIYQAKYNRHSRYKTNIGWTEWADVPKPYYDQRKTYKRIIVLIDGFKLIIYEKAITRGA